MKMKKMIFMMFVVIFLAGCATQQKPGKITRLPDKGRVK